MRRGERVLVLVLGCHCMVELRAAVRMRVGIVVKELQGLQEVHRIGGGFARNLVFRFSR